MAQNGDKYQIPARSLSSSGINIKYLKKRTKISNTVKKEQASLRQNLGPASAACINPVHQLVSKPQHPWSSAPTQRRKSPATVHVHDLVT